MGKHFPEIDIMGTQGKTTALFGECKWTKAHVDTGILETLARRSRLFHYSDVQLYLFARSGFMKGCEELAARLGNVSLVRYRDVVERLLG